MYITELLTDDDLVFYVPFKIPFHIEIMDV